MRLGLLAPTSPHQNRKFRTSHRKRRNGLRFEALERRQMMAAELTTTLVEPTTVKVNQKSAALTILASKNAPPPTVLNTTVDFELFDGVTVPALPGGWATTTTAANNWVTVGTGSHTAPNHAFVANVDTVSDNRLTSPVFAASAANGRISFLHSYDTEATYDGGRLEISIAGGAFADIISAGGAFISGGYSGPIDSGFGNPLSGLQAWTGNSGGYVSTVVDVPTSAFGQNVQLRWRFGTDSSVSQVGWRVDTIQLSDIPNPPTLDFGDAPAAYPVTLANNGARHTVGALRLGALADAEADGTASSTASADGVDEDGVVFQTGLDPGQVETVVVTASQAGGLLNAWFDWNSDGDWNDAGEQTFTNTPLVAGVNSLAVTVPGNAFVGNSFARFRLSTASNLGVTGAAADGEVEDHQIGIGQRRLVWVNRGQVTDRFAETFGANASLARGVVDAVFASWERVVTNLNHELFNGPGVINITVSMAASGTGFGASAGASFQAGFPTSGNVTVSRGNDTTGDGLGDGAGFFLDPTPMDHSEFQGNPTGSAFMGFATPGGPAAGLSDLFTLVNAEITHSIGLFSTPARVNNPINGTVTNTGVSDTSEGGGVGTYFVFDGPSVTHLMTSNNGGGGGQDFGSAIHTAGNPGAGTNQPLAFNSNFRGARNLVGSDNPGNAVYAFGQRTLVNDVLALIFQDAYGYGITLPQTFGTTYAFMDEANSNLIVRGGLNTSHDVINVSRQGNEIVVSVNIGNDVAGTGPNGDASDLPAFISRFPAAGINTITINGSDGNDSISVSPDVTAAITINGGTHTIGDSLSFDLTGATGVNFVNNGNGTGTLTATNRSTITWSNIEIVTPIVTVTSGNSTYNNSVYTATASLAGNNTPAPALSFVYYSDASGLNTIAAPENVGSYFVRAFSAANAGNNAAQSAITPFQITPFGLTGNVTVADKAFDGNTSATILARTLVGVFPGDTVSYIGGTATFDTAAVGNGKTVTATGLSLTGADAGNYTVNTTATTTANITAAAATIANRRVFYNNAPGPNLSSAGAANAAIASDKSPLLPGGSSGFANYTNYVRGLNGLIVDINNLPSTTTDSEILASLQFAQWNGISVGGFSALPGAAIPSATILAGSGVSGSARVKITFPDNSLRNTWLRVTVLANAQTALATDDVFYFGNVVGELNIGNTATRLRVNGQDTNQILLNQSPGANSALVNNIYDVDRNGRVNGQDTNVLLTNQQAAGIVAPITVPPILSASFSAPPATKDEIVLAPSTLSLGASEQESSNVDQADPTLRTPVVSQTRVRRMDSSQRIASGQLLSLINRATNTASEFRDSKLDEVDNYFATLEERLSIR